MKALVHDPTDGWWSQPMDLEDAHDQAKAFADETGRPHKVFKLIESAHYAPRPRKEEE